MKRELTEAEIITIENALRRGDRIEAIRHHMSVTMGNLSEAQNAINALSASAAKAHSAPGKADSAR